MWSEVCGIFASELYVLVVEGQSHLHGEASHDVLDERLGLRDAVEVFHVMELLNDFQVGLEILDLGSKILGNFLH